MKKGGIFLQSNKRKIRYTPQILSLRCDLVSSWITDGVRLALGDSFQCVSRINHTLIPQPRSKPPYDRAPLFDSFKEEKIVLPSIFKGKKQEIRMGTPLQLFKRGTTCGQFG